MISMVAAKTTLSRQVRPPATSAELLSLGYTSEEAAGDADPRWVAGSDGVYELLFSADTASSYHVVCEARLGGLTWTWEQALDGASVRIAAPPEAFLHELATDYLTALHVHVVGTDASGAVSAEFDAPTAFVAWPEGRDGAAVVWDAATAADRAPHGVVSPTLQAALVDVPAEVWFQAPVSLANMEVE